MRKRGMFIPAIWIAVLVLWTLPVSAQDILWSRTYGNGDADEGNCVQQTTDGGYIVCGSSRSFGVPSVDAYLIKADSLGHIMWTRCYGGTGADNTRSLQQTADGGYIASGQTDALGAGGADDMYLIKIDSLGNITWTRTYGGTRSEAARFIGQTDDGGCILTGGTTSSGAGGEDFFLLKADSLGDTLWARTYGGGSGDAGHCVRQTSDGGYIVAGDTKSFGVGGYDVYLIKTDSLGDTLWTRTYGGSNQDGAKSVQQTSDGGYIVAGTTDSFGAGDSNVCIIKLDSFGDTLWTRVYGGSSEDVGYWIQQTSDGGYMVAGWTYSFGSGDRDAYLIKTDATGEIIWSRVYGGDSGDHAFSVQQTTDAGFIVTGGTSSFDGSSNVWLTKLDSEGNSCVGEFVLSTVSVVSPTITSPPTEVNPFVAVIGTPASTVTSPPTEVTTVCMRVCGDVTGDGIVNIADVVYLVNYLYRGDDPPDPPEAGDVNCDGIIDVGDVVYLINYLYRGGPPPCC